MQSSDIYRTLTPIFRDVFDDETIAVVPELSADHVDGWDSLNHIRLMLSVQKAFGVKFSAQEISRLKTVGDLVELVHAKL